MANPLAKTFELLGLTSNPNAPELLIAGLDVPVLAIQQAAVKAIASRDFAVGQVAVITRWNDMSPEARERTAQNVDQLGVGIRQCLRHGDENQALSAISLVSATSHFRSFRFLFDAHKRDVAEVSSAAAECAFEMCEQLYFALHPEEAESTPELRVYDLKATRESVLNTLCEALEKFDDLPAAARIVECFLMLAEADSVATRQVFANPRANDDVVEQLVNGNHRGIARFLFTCLGITYPPEQVFDAFASRADTQFVHRFLTWLPTTFTPYQKANLAKLNSMPWLVKYRQLTETIPDELQPALVRFVQASGLKEFRKTAILKWLLQHGSAAGRSAAAEAVSGIDDVTAQAIVEDGLGSEDENVQAWATSQLRSHKVPDALSKLVERLDSPLKSVRDAARQELQSFDIERMLSIFNQLDPNVCLSAGQLIQKINPNCVEDLVEELNSPIHQKRVRAAHGALALGLHTSIIPELLAMVCDAEQSVRKAAADVLGHLPAEHAAAPLEMLSNDASRFVRDAATTSLARIRLPASQ